MFVINKVRLYVNHSGMAWPRPRKSGAKVPFFSESEGIGVKGGKGFILF